jgi:formylglycine-generating enzyme required for sulfatase activity
MVKVPPGRFTDRESAGRRELLVSRPFEIGINLVTQALWQAVMGSGSSMFRGEDRPVEQVSWEDVQVFLVHLDDLGFPGFRLPAEAEWVWAARCGAPTRWVGADRARSVAVMEASRTAPVAGLSPSPSGVFDVSGNAWEWQQDGWVEAPPAGVDVQGPASESERVVRGGAWLSGQISTRISARSYYPPYHSGRAIGFRLLRSLS